MPKNDAGETIVVLRGAARNRAHGRHVVVLEAAAQRVGHELLGRRLHEPIGVLQQRVAQVDHAVDLGAVDEPCASRRSVAMLLGAPAADRVEVLHREADGVHDLVAARAERPRGVQLHLLAQRARMVLRPGLLLERRHVRAAASERARRRCSRAPTRRAARATCVPAATSRAGCCRGPRARGARRSRRARGGSGCRRCLRMP